MRPIHLVTVFVVLAFLAGYAAGQRQVPTQTVGQSEELLRSLDLTTELESTKGRPLRMRKVTLQPGGVLGLHNHVDRPAITYLLQGEMTYHYEEKLAQVVKPEAGLPKAAPRRTGRRIRGKFRSCGSRWIFRSRKVKGESFSRGGITYWLSIHK